MDRLHISALLHDHLTKIRQSCVQSYVILLWLGPDKINLCLQLSTLYSLEKVADFSAIVHSTVAMIYGALHYCILLA